MEEGLTSCYKNILIVIVEDKSSVRKMAPAKARLERHFKSPAPSPPSSSASVPASPAVARRQAATNESERACDTEGSVAGTFWVLYLNFCTWNAKEMCGRRWQWSGGGAVDREIYRCLASYDLCVAATLETERAPLLFQPFPKCCEWPWIKQTTSPNTQNKRAAELFWKMYSHDFDIFFWHSCSNTQKPTLVIHCCRCCCQRARTSTHSRVIFFTPVWRKQLWMER